MANYESQREKWVYRIGMVVVTVLVMMGVFFLGVIYGICNMMP